MKELIENSIKYYNNIFKTPAQVLEHLFATNGNGLDLNNHLKFNSNYSSEEVYEFPEPVPYKFIYPWSETERYQPFRKYIGCKDVGFKESVEYFLACVAITPDEIAKEWKENIDLIREVLSEEIELPTYDKDDIIGFINSLKNPSKVTNNHGGCDPTQIHPDSVRKVWFLDAQWSDLPEEIEEEVKHLWSDYELGNDRYICKRTVDEELFEDYPKIYLWCRHKGIPEDEEVIIHWWW